MTTRPGLVLPVGLAILMVAGSAQAGLPVRSDESRPGSVLETHRRPRGFVPSDAKTVWGRFVSTVETARDEIPRPAVLDPARPLPETDLGDGFLGAFEQERGLRKKLSVLATYRATMGRCRRWLETLPADVRTPFLESFRVLDREGLAAERTLVAQLSADMERGGGALRVVLDHVQRTGYAESTAQDAFGGLLRGLKTGYAGISQGGNLEAEALAALGRDLEAFERLVSGR